MLTANTITDQIIRDLRATTLKAWSERGKNTPWAEGEKILRLTILALTPGVHTEIARAGCAEILNAREVKS